MWKCSSSPGSRKRSSRNSSDTPDKRLHLLPSRASPGTGAGGPDAVRVRCEFRREFGIRDDEILLLLIGSGFITKGLDRALIAIGSLPDNLRESVRFFVIGQDNPRQFLRLAGDLQLEDRLTIFSGRDDVPRFLQGADIMIHPAYMESGGIVLIEALVAGLPVIATDVCGFAHYVEESGGGTLIGSPFSQEALNAELAHMVADDAFPPSV